MKTHFLLRKPTIHKNSFLADGVKIIGDVRISKNVSIWYNSVIRGDLEYISIDEGTNIQDASVLHIDHNRPCIIGKNVTCGHNVNLHGCTIENGCLIGMGAVILSGTLIKKGSIVAAGSVVKENTIVEKNSFMAGVPAKLIKNDKNFYKKNVLHAKNYIKLYKEYKKHKIS